MAGKTNETNERPFVVVSLRKSVVLGPASYRASRKEQAQKTTSNSGKTK